MEDKLITYTTNELKMCENIARASHPSEYRDIFKHITLCTKPYGDLHPEVWINKMTAKTTSMWEKNHPYLQMSDMIEEVLVDSGIKHMNFK